MAEAAAFSSGLAPQVERAHRRLTEKELLRASDDAVSVLLPGRGAMLFWAGSDAALQELPLSDTTAQLPPESTSALSPSRS